MRFRRLCKAANSMGEDDECPAVYVGDDPAVMIAQGKILDPTVRTALLDLADDETAVQIPTETVLRAVGLYLAERGRPDLLAEIEFCLARDGLAEVTR